MWPSVIVDRKGNDRHYCDSTATGWTNQEISGVNSLIRGYAQPSERPKYRVASEAIREARQGLSEEADHRVR